MPAHKEDCICLDCEAREDSERIDALERYVTEHRALVIHLGGAYCGGHSGLAFGGPTTSRRSLRAALDQLRKK